MKKILVLVVAAAFAFMACGSPSGKAPEPGKSITVPSDTAKIDTVKGLDTVIRG